MFTLTANGTLVRVATFGWLGLGLWRQSRRVP